MYNTIVSAFEQPKSMSGERAESLAKIGPMMVVVAVGWNDLSPSSVALLCNENHVPSVAQPGSQQTSKLSLNSRSRM